MLPPTGCDARCILLVAPALQTKLSGPRLDLSLRFGLGFRGEPHATTSNQLTYTRKTNSERLLQWLQWGRPMGLDGHTRNTCSSNNNSKKNNSSNSIGTNTGRNDSSDK